MAPSNASSPSALETLVLGNTIEDRAAARSALARSCRAGALGLAADDLLDGLAGGSTPFVLAGHAARLRAHLAEESDSLDITDPVEAWAYGVTYSLSIRLASACAAVIELAPADERALREQVPSWPGGRAPLDLIEAREALRRMPIDTRLRISDRLRRAVFADRALRRAAART